MVSPKEAYRTAKTVQITHHGLQALTSEVRWFRLSASAREKDFAPEKQPIMCDFDVVKDEQIPSRFYISLLLEMEDSRKTDKVLSFVISTVTEFDFRPNAESRALPEDEAERWGLFRIGISTAIGTARGYLANYLAPTIYRDYILPMLDVQELFNRKYIRPELPAVPSAAPNEEPPRTPRAKKGEK